MKYRSNLVKLYGIRALFWMQFFSPVLVPFYTDWGGLKLSQVLFLNAWFMFCNFLFEVPTGTIADRFGRKTSLALGHLVAAAAAVVYVSRPSFENFLIAETIFAVAYTLHSGADEALAYDSLAAERRETESKRAFSRMESFKLGGILVSALTGGFVAATFGLPSVMHAYVLPSLLGFALACTLAEPPVVTAERRDYFAMLREGGAYFLSHKTLLVLALESAATHALAWSVIWLYQPLLLRAGAPIEYLGVVNVLACAAQIFVLSRIEALERIFGSKRNLLLGSSAVAGVSFALSGLVPSLPVLTAALVATFAFGLTRIPMFNSYMHKYVPSEKRATVLSAASMTRTLAIVVVNPLTGLLADRSLTGAAVALGAALIVLPLFSRLEEKHLID